MKLIDGQVYAAEYCFRTDTDGALKNDAHGRPHRYPVWGDGTVHRESASLSRRTIPIFAQHGALAAGRQARLVVTDFLLEDDHLGPDQAEEGIGLNVPDYVTPAMPWGCFITGSDDPAEVTCTIAATDEDWKRAIQLASIDDDKLGSKVTVPKMGLYRVTATTDYGITVPQLVFAGSDGQTYLDD
ncbi:hypothetical protein [Streptomyces sp. NPDC060022]|uniref:hypothetical protein n=1 Tax=Streptomyces sp. NPDC060022 TaxID=3347039 RepID=UPI0036C7FFCB